MADFDNGLPPHGTDITESEISAVLIDKAKVEVGGVYSINAVIMEKEGAQEGEVWSVSAILIDKQDADYQNKYMFL